MKLRFPVLLFSCLLSTAVFQHVYAQNDEICNAIFLNPRCSNNGFYTYANNGFTGSPQAAPACGNYSGGDLWFKTIVPSSRKLDIITQEGTLWDGAMAVYRSSSCTGTLTLLGCDDDSGPNFMPQLNLTGLTTGDSIFIRFWEFGNDEPGTFQIAVHDPNPTYCMVGNSTQNYPGTCIQLTREELPGISAVWSNAKINLANPIDYTFTAYFGTLDGTGADGITFVLQNSPAGTTAIGSSGNFLGIGGLPNSLIVEFDTYDNGGPMDISQDHIAISLNGDLANPVSGPIRARPNIFPNNIEDGAFHTIRITWNPGTRVFSVYFDGIFRLSYTGDIINTIFGGNSLVYWGFSGTNGFFSNDQIICPGNLPLPVEWGDVQAYPKNQQVFVDWVTFSETNSSEFIIERSGDGIEFRPVGKVQAAGNSSSPISYQFIDQDPLPGISYYRLKQTDQDGSYTYSHVLPIEFKNADQEFDLYPNPAGSAEKLTVQFNWGGEETEIEFSLLNNLGQSVFTTTVGRVNNHVTLPGELPAGIYHVILKTGSGVHSKKLVISNP